MKTIDEIYADMIGEYFEITGLALTDNGDMAIRMRAAASQFFTLWTQAEWLKKQCFPQTAEGIYLDYHAELRGIFRNGAVPATGVIRFAVRDTLASDLYIPVGTLCATAEAREFITVSDGTIATGSLYCDVRAEARAPGADGNVLPASISFMTFPPTGVTDCYNPLPFSGGADSESDELLRARVVNSYRLLPNGANAAFYETQALQIDGVAAAVVRPRARGPGSVDILISSHGGLPSDDLLRQVQSSIDALREICVSVEVKAPEPDVLDVSVSISHDGHDFADVCGRVEESVRAYFSGKLLGKSVLLAELGNLVYSVEGVSNYRFNAPAEDINNDGTALPVLGTLTITQIGV